MSPSEHGIDVRVGGKLPHEFELEDLAQYFHLSINDAAAQLNICTTLLKKLCRKNQIPRWPYRKVKGVLLMINQVEDSLAIHPDDPLLLQQLDQLKEKHNHLLTHPNEKYSQLLPKSTRKPSCIDKPSKTIHKKQSFLKPPTVPNKFELVSFPPLKETQPENQTITIEHLKRSFSELSVCEDRLVYEKILKDTPMPRYSRITFVK